MPVQQKADLVLEGGGVKGAGLAGALAALKDAGLQEVGRVAGTSAGAIVAAFLAAGMPASRMHDLLVSQDFAKFQDGDLLLHFTLGKALDVLLHDGAFKGDYLHKWLGGQLAGCGVTTWADLYRPDPGSALPPEQQYALVVIVSDVTRGRMLRLPWDYHALCGVDPKDVLVADAIRASASIPFFFRPVHLTCTPPGADRPRQLTFVDGGMLSNFPVWLFDRTDGRPARWPTYGIKLSARPTGADPALATTGTPVDLAMALLKTLTSAHDRFYVDQPCVQNRTIFVDTTGVKSTDFELSQQTKQEPFDQPQRAGAEFAGGWDWAAWQRQCGNPPQ
jgi:NTE family protein